MSQNKPAILLVEDDKVDAMTVKRALKEIHVTNPLDIVGNGEEGLAYLRDSDKKLEQGITRPLTITIVG